MISGVCSGLADYFGIDATIVRIVLIAVTLLTGGTGILLYVAAALVVPDEGKETSIAQDLINKQTNKSNSDFS
jgi:phage shock protein C